MPTRAVRILSAALLIALLALPAAGDWGNWRGPTQDGVAADGDLISTWSKDGTHLIWRADFSGRSTPVVFDGRVCANGRVGSEITRQAVAACWNAETGEELWQRRFDIYQTTVPWNRVGWASVAGDPETGYLFVHTVNGHLVALDRDGETVWEWILAEDLGEQSGYGGRTHTPIVDEDRVILGSITASWGPFTPPRHRYYAFDKRTGEIQWVSNPALGLAGDINTQSTPVVAVIDDRRLLIGGNADGWVHALEARTGRPVWRFQLSQRGLNASVAVAGDTVFASHSEENVDSGTMGRVVAIDATGSGDVSASHERWRVDEITAGFPTPLVHDGTVYVLDNAANLHALDAGTGASRWQADVGTVGKSAPVWGDGKIYVTEVNGNVVILEPGDDAAKVLDEEHLEMPEGDRYAEIYASPAIAYGRIYFTTEEGIYCLGDPDKGLRESTGGPGWPAAEPSPASDAPAAQLVIVPGEVLLDAGETRAFRVDAYDDKGRFLHRVEAPQYGLAGVRGELDGDTVRIPGDAPSHSGFVTAKVGDLEARARVRVDAGMPYHEDFESVEVGGKPGYWRPVHKGAKVQEVDGSKVLVQPKAARNAPRATIYIGDSSWSGYTIQADVKGNFKGRRYTDVGLTNSGYTFDMQGAHQRLAIRSWPSERRMAQKQDHEWEMGVWYTMKLRVDIVPDDQGGDKAVIRGKVWKRAEAEPDAWTMTVEDPQPIRHGSPALYTFAPVESYFDNVKVTVNQ